MRGPLRQLAAHEGTTPDWSTLRVTGPEEVVGRYGVSSSEWTATVKNLEEPAGYL